MPLPCVILAGGLGTRMRPLSESIPKTLLPVLGRPFADLQLNWLRSQGVCRVVYCIGHLGGAIRAHVGDGAQYDLEVDYTDEGDHLRGTGGALRLTIDEGRVTGPFFVLNGDSFLTVDLTAMQRAYEASSCAAMMSVLRNDDRWGHSNARVTGAMVELYEKVVPARRAPGTCWIDYGISILHADVVTAAIPPGSIGDLADVMRDLSRSRQLAAFEVVQRFFEIGSPAGLSDLERHLRTL